MKDDTWPVWMKACDCGGLVECYPGEGDVTCSRGRCEYNAGGQRLIPRRDSGTVGDMTNLQAGVPVKIRSAASKGMTPTEAEKKTLYADPETCSTCGQPDNCGDCDHTPLSAEDFARLDKPARA